MPIFLYIEKVIWWILSTFLLFEIFVQRLRHFLYIFNIYNLILVASLIRLTFNFIWLLLITASAANTCFFILCISMIIHIISIWLTASICLILIRSILEAAILLQVCIFLRKTRFIWVIHIRCIFFIIWFYQFITYSTWSLLIFLTKRIRKVLILNAIIA